MSPDRLGKVCLFCVYFLWGSIFLGNRLAVESIPPLLAVFVRHGTAGILLFLALVGFGKWSTPARSEAKNALLVGAIIAGVASGALIWAGVNVPSAYAALAFTTMPLYLLIFNWVAFERVRPGLLDLVALPLSLLGSGLVLSSGESLSGGHIRAFDILLLVFCPAAWAFGSLLGRRLRMPKDALASSVLQMLGGAILLAVLSAARGDWSRFSMALVTERSIFGELYITIGGSLFGYTAFAIAIRNLDPRLVGTYAIVNPVIAVWLGMLFGEKVGSPLVLLGIILAVSGVLLTFYAAARRAPPGLSPGPAEAR